MVSTYPLVPIANFFACILVLASMSKKLFQSWNVGACSFAIWTIVLSFVVGVDSIIWADNTHNVAPVWCDIVTRLQVGFLTAISASSFVIIRRLSLMLRQRTLSTVRGQTQILLTDFALCLGAPVVLMPLAFVVQAGRFTIIEEYGCSNASVNCGLSVLLSSFFPLLLSGLSLILYSPRLVRMYFKQKELEELFKDTTHIDRRGFTKLLALGLLDIIITLPIAILNLLVGFLAGGGIHTFWPGWRTIHARVSSIATVPAAEWKSAGRLTVFEIRLNQWISALYAVLFFVLFGLTEKNKRRFRSILGKVMKPFRFRPRQNHEASDFVAYSGHVPSSIGSEIYTIEMDRVSSVGTEEPERSVSGTEETKGMWMGDLGTQAKDQTHLFHLNPS